jgi:hypothetical protein
MAGTSVLVLGLGMTACDRAESAGGAVPRVEPAAVLPATLFASSAPGQAREVGAVRADAALRGPVVVHGRIGGRAEPFVDERATFLLVDTSLPTCNERHGDGCPTPWDYCCETPQTILANTLTIQVVDSSGRLLKTSLEGQHGLKPSARVTVEGEIVQRDESAVIVNARSIFVES